MKKDQEIDTSSLIHHISHLSKRTPKNGAGAERAWYLIWEAADRCLLKVGHSECCCRGLSVVFVALKWFRNTLKSISFQITSRKNRINLKRYRLSNRLLQCPVLRCSISYLSFSRLRDSRSFNLTQLCAGRFYENRLVAREVDERQLNHNMTFQVAVQKLTSLGVKFEILVTTGSPSYFKSRANGWYTVTERIHERL